MLLLDNFLCLLFVFSLCFLVLNLQSLILGLGRDTCNYNLMFDAQVSHRSM